jgi:hypothetical protein
MEYQVIATGAQMFDACHTSGLGVLLAHATNAPVELTRASMGYRLSTHAAGTPALTPEVIRDVLTIPDAATLADPSVTSSDLPIALGNLDGLLAAAFTSRGARLVSVQDARNKQTLNDEACKNAVDKASALVERLITYTERQERRTAGGIAALLTMYMSNQPASPVFTTKSNQDVTLPMAIDPMLGYSTRQPLSDGRITQNTNLAVQNMPLAAPLAFIGAARFLRAQRCANKLVNLYLPLPRHIIITAAISLPLLTGTSFPVEQALAVHWLHTAEQQSVSNADWQALAYHTLQTQGTQQSFSRDAGVLDYSWLQTLQQRAGTKLVASWRKVLHRPRETVSYELDVLTDCLLHRSGAAWLQHLDEIAHILIQQPDLRVRRYTDCDVKEITQMLQAQENLPLRVVLAQEHGTRRFGHALRQLGKYNPSALREFADDLDAVRDLDQLLRLLAQITQTCAVLKAKSEFIIVPTDDDLDILLADVDQFGVKRIASVVLILAVLRYPREEREEPADSPGQAETETEVYEEVTP